MIRHCSFCDVDISGDTKPTLIPGDGIRYFCPGTICVSEYCWQQWQAKAGSTEWRTARTGNWFRQSGELLCVVFKRKDGKFGGMISEKVEDGEVANEPPVFLNDAYSDPEEARMAVDDLLEG